VGMMVRSQVMKVMVAEGHGGERKQKKWLFAEKWIQKAGFRPTLSSIVFSFLSMKFAPIYRDTKRVILSSTGKKSQPLIRLEESKPSVQSVHLELPNLAVQGCRLSEVATLGQ
jgi:hypothetical protein